LWRRVAYPYNAPTAQFAWYSQTSLQKKVAMQPPFHDKIGS
jgi:hypothetical protein